MRPGTDGFIPVHSSWANNADGKCPFLHFANLHIAGMGAQQPVGMLRDIKSILHVAGRMVFGKIQCSEVVPVIFYLGAIGNRKSQPLKDADYPVPYQGYRVSRSDSYRIAG